MTLRMACTTPYMNKRDVWVFWKTIIKNPIHLYKQIIVYTPNYTVHIPYRVVQESYGIVQALHSKINYKIPHNPYRVVRAMLRVVGRKIKNARLSHNHFCLWKFETNLCTRYSLQYVVILSMWSVCATTPNRKFFPVREVAMSLFKPEREGTSRIGSRILINRMWKLNGFWNSKFDFDWC